MDELKEAQRRFDKAIEIGMLMLRYNLGRSPGVCPVCYCDALIDMLEDVRDLYDHNEEVEPMTKDDIAAMALMMANTRGNA